ncbi:MAG: octaprenyl diphosphate synthase [Gammaproteobacteria bacterium]|nr:octaprenyl diphosphate synthase [Gammaproteobacteria bacterium]|tara:strand:+ start:471 stop:1442 length:972 start_codon:yes stop_codon:yes gene_type:complete
MPTADQLIDLIRPDFDALNELLTSQLGSEIDLIEEVSQYLIQSGGKRVRPLVTLMAARALKTNNMHHIPLAGSIECLHTATLFHDDVVDNSEARRGQPSANAAFGNAASILVGDFIYSRAFQMMVSVGRLDVLKVLADTTNQISEGEVWQLKNQHRTNVSESEYNQVITRKTAVLFEAATACAGLVTDQPSEIIEALKRYGLQLGFAFQLIDDYLDYAGDTNSLGKNLGDDLADGKCTLPLIRALTEATAAEQAVINRAITAGDRDRFYEISKIVTRTSGLSYTKARAFAAVDQAKKALEILPDSVFREGLMGLADLSVSRAT